MLLVILILARQAHDDQNLYNEVSILVKHNVYIEKTPPSGEHLA